MKDEDLDQILDEMEQEGEWGDVTTGLRRAYAARIRRALAKHDTELMMKCMQTFMGQAREQKKDS